MRSVVLGASAAGLILIGASEVGAQDAGWWDWALEEAVAARYGDYDDRDDYADRDRRDRYDRRDARYRDRYDRGYGLEQALIEIILGRRGDDWEYGDRRRSRARGPAFCRSGRGHPVHGRRWCRERGWGVYARYPRRWDRRVDWGDIILMSAPRRRTAYLDRRDLTAILGEAVLRRLIREARLDRRAPLSGRWLQPHDRMGVLQLRSGSVPVAELSDVDGDRRVDAVLVPRR
ncbi:MAG: hypothetical protein R3314_13755 [Longimicrobiales bacterium]|nr:hypothetical protein [Longimicrobiales bacterium]